MASTFKPQVSGNLSGYPDVREFGVTAAEAFEVGELVYMDVNTGLILVCGADPALIAGISGAAAAFGLGSQWPGNIYDGVKIPVTLLNSNTLVFMSSTTTPLLTHVGNAYGVAKVGHTWQVDTGDTSATRVVVVDIYNSPQQEGFLVKFLAANLQFDAVAS